MSFTGLNELLRCHLSTLIGCCLFVCFSSQMVVSDPSLCFVRFGGFLANSDLARRNPGFAIPQQLLGETTWSQVALFWTTLGAPFFGEVSLLPRDALLLKLQLMLRSSSSR